MNHYHYQNGQLFCENVPLAAIGAKVKTPVYVHSQSILLVQVRAFIAAAPPNTLICYAIKANGNPALIRLIADSGLGADVTSGGELFLAQRGNIPPGNIIFSGVGKTETEIALALDAHIRALHVESEMELATIARIAENKGRVAAIGVRVNPNINAETHPHISTGLQAHKFGVNRERAIAMLLQAAKNPWLKPIGLAAHIGSQITKLAPFEETGQFLIHLAKEMADLGIQLEYVDVGGGLGIDYDKDWRVESEDSEPSFSNLKSQVSISDWVTAVSQPIASAGYKIVLEPGRSIIGPTGLLLTEVIYTKTQGERQFIITDAGMNDLIRPALYQAHHPILTVQQPVTDNLQPVDIVGPICETSDYMAKGRPLPPVQSGDLLAVMQAGAYGFAMSSNYNGRLRPAEVLVYGDQFRIIRHRQQLAHLLDGCIEDSVWENTD